jgi:CheY-like chemotaxis protein
MGKRRRIGEILLEGGVLTETLLEQALQRQKGRGRRIGEILEEMGVASDRHIAAALARQFSLKTVRGIADNLFPDNLLKLVPGDQALKNLIFPLKVDKKTLFLAMANPLDLETLDYLMFRTGLGIIPCVATPAEIREAIQKHYFREEQEDQTEGWTILVVEDQELARAAILAALSNEGYHTLAAANGAEGLHLACRRLPHLIVADILMPRMDGYDMFRGLKADPNTRSIPVIALSAKAAAEEEARLLEMGFLDFVAKPVNPVRLSARVKKALALTYAGNRRRGGKFPLSRSINF